MTRVYRMRRAKGKPGNRGARQWKNWKQVEAIDCIAWAPEPPKIYADHVEFWDMRKEFAPEFLRSFQDLTKTRR